MWTELQDERFVAFDGDWEAFEKKNKSSIGDYWEFLMQMKKVSQRRKEEREKVKKNRRK